MRDMQGQVSSCRCQSNIFLQLWLKHNRLLQMYRNLESLWLKYLDDLGTVYIETLRTK